MGQTWGKQMHLRYCSSLHSGESQMVLLPGSHGSPLQTSLPMARTGWGGLLGPAAHWSVHCLFWRVTWRGLLAGQLTDNAVACSWMRNVTSPHSFVQNFIPPSSSESSFIGAGFTGRGSFYFKSLNWERASSAFGRPDLLLCTVGLLLKTYIGDSWAKCLELIAVGLCLKLRKSTFPF